MKQSWPSLWYYRGILLEGLTKTTNTFSQDGRSSGQGSKTGGQGLKTGSPEDEAGIDTHSKETFGRVLIVIIPESSAYTLYVNSQQDQVKRKDEGCMRKNM
jgi:hypothetical protein